MSRADSKVDLLQTLKAHREIIVEIVPSMCAGHSVLCPYQGNS